MVQSRRILNASAALLLIIGLGYCVSGYISAEDRVKKVCALITPGMQVGLLAAFAEQHGLKMSGLDEGGSGTRFLMEMKTSGRHGCKVMLKDGTVSSAEYNFTD